MKSFAILAAATLVLTPAAAFARECDKEPAMICQDGFTWDSEAQACVGIVSGPTADRSLKSPANS